MRESVGIVGLGLVGSALAGLLLRAGFAVVGHDVRDAAVQVLERQGGQAAGGAAEVARRCRRVILSLPGSPEVEDAVWGPGGLLSAGAPPEVVVDTTTGDPRRVEAMAGRLAARGVALLDAPVAGSSRQIAGGNGVFLVGGDPEAHRSCADLFAALSDTVLSTGPAGSGSRAKLAVNLVLGLNRLVLAEGLVFARSMGIGAERALELFARTPAYSRAVDVKGRRMVEGDFTPEARLAQHRKDVGLMLDLARAAGQELPLTKAHAALLDAAVAAGDGDLDNSAVIREVARRAWGGGAR